MRNDALDLAHENQGIRIPLHLQPLWAPVVHTRAENTAHLSEVQVGAVG